MLPQTTNHYYHVARSTASTYTQTFSGVETQLESKHDAVKFCEPSTRYYRVMTRAERMPALIDEVI